MTALVLIIFKYLTTNITHFHRHSAAWSDLHHWTKLLHLCVTVEVVEVLVVEVYVAAIVIVILQ